MKKVKKEKNEKPTTACGPVSYNRSILAAFEKQIRGKICPLCKVKFSLASYNSHMNECNIAEDDEEIEVLATYTREEAILMRAGPEIVLEESFLEKSEAPSKKRKSEEKVDIENSADFYESGDCNVPGPSGMTPEVTPELSDVNAISKNADKFIEKLPEVGSQRRRSTRLVQNSRQSQINNMLDVIKDNLLKKETPTIAQVIKAIEDFETRISMSERNWPYYMKCTVNILKRVISTKKFDNTYYSDDFWLPEDIITFYRFVEQLSEEAKCLLVRLFIRKPVWYHLEKLEKKYTEIPNIREAVVELTKGQFIYDDSSIKSLDEAFPLADVTILKSVAKKFKIYGNKNRDELIQSLRKFAQYQKSIFGGADNVEKLILKSLKQELGACVKVRNGFIDLFKSLFTLYCPVTTNSANTIDNSATNLYQNLLFMMLSVQNGSVHFPAPNPCHNIASFYKNRKMLYDYVVAKSLETLLTLRMSNGNLDSAFDICIEAKEFMDQISADDKFYYQSLEINERKFTAMWVYTRCCGHATTILERQKKWGMAVEWQKDLLVTSKECKSYCLDSRGVWWDRMLLNLDSHLKERKECAKMIQIALLDPSVLEKDLLLIQDRAMRLKEMPPNFIPPINIEIPQKKVIYAKTISKNLGDGRINRFMIHDEENGDCEECSVEEVSRRWYLKKEGFTMGVHDEGATWHTIFGLLCYDIIFSTDEVLASMWLSELQDCPTDLSNTLYLKRKEKFEDRFEWLKEAEKEIIEENIRKIWDLKLNETNRECSWIHFPTGVESCVDLVQCIPRSSLIAIFRRLAESYRNSRSGFPDLTLWNPETKAVAVVEVKGPGDQLSTKQRLWLDFFADNGIKAEVCHVEAQNSKRLV